MARTASVAIGGYYPFPSHLLPALLSHLSAPWVPGSYDHDDERWSLLDPCAGDGAALNALRAGLFPLNGPTGAAMDYGQRYDRDRRAKTYAVELERERFQRLEAGTALHADSFLVQFTPGCASLLFLNPPYDTERGAMKRTEARFLERWAQALAPGGVLVFVVPHYALTACAATLGQHFDEVSCVRLPGADFDTFHQVVLFARRRISLAAPDPSIVAQCEAWSAEAPAAILGSGPVYAIAPRERVDFGTFEVRSVDLQAVFAAYKPWHRTTKAEALETIGWAVPLDTGPRRWPLLMPPRPQHVAAALASGVFDGAELKSSEPGLPRLLVRAQFRKVFQTVATRETKAGAVETQVERPELVVRVLDLDKGAMHELSRSAKATGSRDPATMTVGDLVAWYGDGLLRKLREHCPVTYDPARDAPVVLSPLVKRRLYRAQHHVVSAALRALSDESGAMQPRKSVAVLGEIGCGKSTVALATAATGGAKRVLVLCPPHLLDGWTDQVRAVLPSYRVVRLEDVLDVDALAHERGPFVAVLSRETAKLGSGVEGIGPVGTKGRARHARCPKCGTLAPHAADVLARRRARCEHKARVAKTLVAHYAERLAQGLACAAPSSARVRELVTAPLLRSTMNKLAAEPREDGGMPTAKQAVLAVLWPIARAMMEAASYSDQRRKLRSVVELLLRGLGDKAVGLEMVEWLRTGELLGHLGHYEIESVDLARKLGMAAWLDSLRELPLDSAHRKAASGPAKPEAPLVPTRSAEAVKQWLLALEVLCDPLSGAAWEEQPKCGEPLWQYVPVPRRIPLADYIVRSHRGLFDFLVIDEAHEYGGAGTAQGLAADRLSQLGMPSLELTGSASNGYAVSLFAMLWRTGSLFRKHFAKGHRERFGKMYGYVEREVSSEGVVKERGTNSDRETNVRQSGYAPGVLPVVLLRYLLGHAVTLQQSDLETEIQPKAVRVVHVAPTKEMLAEHDRMLDKLTEEMRKNRFVEDRAGKLLGALAAFVTYPDRCTRDVGNVEGGGYRIAWPDGVEVTSSKGLPASTVTPKEAALLAELRAQLERDRWAMVLIWNRDLAARLTGFLERELGEPVAHLDASKVEAADREAWIRHHCLGESQTVERKRKGKVVQETQAGALRRVLVVNGASVETGLNCLVRAENGRGYCSQLWFQLPPRSHSVRQTEGRVHRVGQTWPVEIIRFVYSGTLQGRAYSLLAKKIQVAQGVDGVNPETALAAIGVGQERAEEMDLGAALWAALDAEGIAAVTADPGDGGEPPKPPTPPRDPGPSGGQPTPAREASPEPSPRPSETMPPIAPVQPRKRGSRACSGEEATPVAKTPPAVPSRAPSRAPSPAPSQAPVRTPPKRAPDPLPKVRSPPLSEAQEFAAVWGDVLRRRPKRGEAVSMGQQELSL